MKIDIEMLVVKIFLIYKTLFLKKHLNNYYFTNTYI